MRKYPHIAAAAAVLALTLVTGCSSDGTSDGKSGDNAKKEAPETATGSLEQLAAKTDCKPNIQTEAAELRQANCKTEDGSWVLATFTTDRGQREWLNSAKDYGGEYLVGRKWVAVGEPEVVKTLRGRLGGTVESGSDHSGSSGSGGNESGHSGHHGS
ncbi:hypothetical protein NLX86_04855 [Streptomyces sp. A3M-1-3]|uniref:hypothetical protein n=1 Tax=Streptomyces sp. A3M-1-3 TaxID=2962044 RepID=UPI0020B6DEC7|nr:hypothetical protein [Streptomyces sp. A3M-1-3]MCP3817488.1 hypothetical protein [Streptomyces sp. A3M-1-3]